MNTATMWLAVLLPLLLFLSQPPLTRASDATPLHTICSSGTYTPKDAFGQNLQMVLDSFKADPQVSGFTIGMAGNKSPVYGLSMCRGDVSQSGCVSCINKAASRIIQKCPGRKGAIIWYDECMFQYAGYNFWHTVDGPKVYMSGGEPVPNPKAFNKDVVSFLNKLVSNASAFENTSRYASGEAQVGGWPASRKIYALAQCSGELLPEACRKCLKIAVRDYPKCCDGKSGGRVLGSRCNFRYELYPFYDMPRLN